MVFFSTVIIIHCLKIYNLFVRVSTNLKLVQVEMQSSIEQFSDVLQRALYIFEQGTNIVIILQTKNTFYANKNMHV